MIAISDGTVVIDTKIDNSGVEKGTRNLKSEVTKLATEYKKAGMSSSQAWKKAWSEIARNSSSGSNKAKGSIESVASVAKKCATVIGSLFILDKIKDFTAGVVKTGIAYNAMAEQSQVAWTTILGSSEKATKMMKDIEQYAAKTPFSKMGVDQMAKQLSNAGFEGQALFDQLTKFGDMGSAFGIQEDSLKEMVRQYAQVQQAQVAYTEDLNILQDRGIPIYKALGEVMGVPVSQVKKLASEGKVTADAYNKAIDSMSNKTKGAMEGQSKTFNGMMSTLKDNLTILAGKLAEPIFENLKNGLQELMPKLETFTNLVGSEGIVAAVEQTFPQLKPLVDILSDLGRILTETVIPAVTDFGSWVLENLGPIGFLASTIGGVALAFKTMSIISGIVAFAQGLAAAFGLLETATLGEAAAQWAANLAFLACPITWIVIAIGALVGGFIYLWVTSEGFRNFWIGLWESIKTFFENCWNGIMDFFTVTIPGWIEGLKQWFIGLPEWFGQLMENIKIWFVDKWNEILTWFQGVPQWFSQILENIKTWFVTKWNEIWTYLFTNIPIWINNIFTWFSELPYKIGYALGFVIGKVIAWGAEVWDYLVTNIPIWINNIGTWFAELPGRIWTWLVNTYNKVVAWGSQMGTKAIQIASTFINDTITWFSQLPNRIWTWLVNTVSKVSSWGNQMWSKATSIASQFVNNTINYIRELPGKIWTWLVNALNKVGQWGSSLFSRGTSAARQLVSAVVETVSSIPGKMLDIGKRIVEGVWNGITGAAGWFKDQVHNFFSGIVDGAKDALGIHSPSRVFRDEIGKWILPGVEIGIDKTMPNLQDNMKDKMLSLVREMKAKVQFETNSIGATIVAKSNGEIASNNVSNGNNVDRPLIVKVENKNYLDGEEIAGHTTEKVIENIGDSQDSYRISTGGDFSFA